MKPYLIFPLALLAGCGGSVVDPVPSSQSAPLTALPRTLSVGEQKVVTAANDFSFSIFRQLAAAQADSNLFTSPLSASMSLGMAMNGAAGTTYTQMRSTLGFNSATDTEMNAGYSSLIMLLRGLDNTVDFRIANSVWYRNGFPFNQSFLDATTTYFDAKVSALDFASPSAPGTINAWVSTATNGKIDKIIETISSDQVMYLINAIYFKGTWRDKFDAAKTIDAPFHGKSGDQAARLMQRSAMMSYASTSDYDAVDLPYGNTAFTMTVVLPKAGKDVQAVAASLQGASWSALVAQMQSRLVDLSLPKLKLTWEKKLNNDLIALGMRDAFSDGIADFTRMSTLGRQLVISEVKQKTYVDINEEGTEAAAVTSTGIMTTSAPLSITVRVDRPYIFVIRERLSGTIIFMGRIIRMP